MNELGLIPTFSGLTFGTEVILIIIALVYALGSVALQRKVSNAKKLRHTQAKMQKVSKELNDMIKRNAPKELIAAKQKEMMPLVGASMKASLKPMFIILPLFLIVYYVLVPALPFGGGQSKQSIQGFFFICIFLIGIVTAIVLMVYDKRAARREQGELESVAEFEQNKTSDK